MIEATIAKMKLLETNNKLKGDISMFHIDVHRPNFAPEAEPEVEIPDELREAFARDIKDMLQEFIDMGDIDYEEGEDN